ncbi:uncharacterized protein N7482_005126 [Penicillium canariense]|uniref:Uncharacterized protein n=1 Tax=Penicillium canariense TaxID=189055 RepID=A0A9W9LMV4_9EURO|nr:uncharacterized protein N7482_005126 [Penicillium canariense]KAJ5166345.1 hypothetical protein N7482_005126 [Penicillium canariense]
MKLIALFSLAFTLTSAFPFHPFHKAHKVYKLHKIHKIKLDASITESQVLTIAPSSDTCDNPPAAGECATANTAATYTAQSFDTYSVTSKAEQAAVLSLMAFESGDFKYNKNHFPGVAGQGTRNMQSPSYNKKYASSLPSLSDKLDSVSDDPAGLLDVLRADKAIDFGSGAWFLTTQCSQDVRTALQKGDDEGWQRYISDCVGTSVTDERRAYWERAVEALGV